MILPIKKWPDPILLENCKEWDFRQPPALPDLAQDLVDTMMSQQALGLAANQVGISYRVVAMNIQAGAHAGQQMVLFNPSIEKASDDLWTATEGCLSFPRVELTIARSKHVYARWYDGSGQSHSAVFSDIDAKCLLHELDHLDGRVFKDLVSDLKFQTALRKSRKK